MSDVLEDLLDRRLLIVTGKGGTGKTTVSVSLALLAARRGLNTVLIEVSDENASTPLLEDRPGSIPDGNGRDPVPVAPNLSLFRVDPREALSEYLELQLYVRPVIKAVTRSPVFRRLLDAAPGWRDLITLGKLWHLESRIDGKRPVWDLLVVDAPATGHGLSFLSVPRVVIETVRMGPLRRHTDWVQALLTDPRRTLVLPVTVGEELPVRETLELCTRVRELGLVTGPLLANAVEPEPDLVDVNSVLGWLNTDPERCVGGLSFEVLRRCLDHASRRAALQRLFLRELREQSKCPVIELPFVPGGVRGLADARAMADTLENALRASGAAP